MEAKVRAERAFQQERVNAVHNFSNLATLEKRAEERRMQPLRDLEQRRQREDNDRAWEQRPKSSEPKYLKGLAKFASRLGASQKDLVWVGLAKPEPRPVERDKRGYPRVPDDRHPAEIDHVD